LSILSGVKQLTNIWHEINNMFLSTKRYIHEILVKYLYFHCCTGQFVEIKYHSLLCLQKTNSIKMRSQNQIILV